MPWDIQRRDGRTEGSDCQEIITVKGVVLSQDKKCIVIQTEDDRLLVQKSSFRYDEMPNTEKFFVLSKTESGLKLIDYI